MSRRTGPCSATPMCSASGRRRQEGGPQARGPRRRASASCRPPAPAQAEPDTAGRLHARVREHDPPLAALASHSVRRWRAARGSRRAATRPPQKRAPRPSPALASRHRSRPASGSFPRAVRNRLRRHGRTSGSCSLASSKNSSKACFCGGSRSRPPRRRLLDRKRDRERLFELGVRSAVVSKPASTK
jgi:hypothetical protein